MTFDSAYEPFFQPPGWIVGPVWAVLYTCLALSMSNMLSAKDEVPQSNLIIALFFVQLAVNLAWPSVFNSERYLLSLLMIVVMIVFTSIYANYLSLDLDLNFSAVHMRHFREKITCALLKAIVN